jgi:hypothetical protein
MPIEKIKSYPYRKCTRKYLWNKRWKWGPLGHVAVGPDGANSNIVAEVHAGVVDAKTKLDVDKDGHVNGAVGGKVNTDEV